MAAFLLIRHGQTQGNLDRRYIGDKDEPLCALGIEHVNALAKSGRLPPVDTVLSGPALRCRQTTELLFPRRPYAICPMGEIDFGVFKGKNADDLKDNPDYADWLETGCMGDIPGGDSVAAFKSRCCICFLQIAEKHNNGLTALVIHGGNIMSILEQFSKPKQDFYQYRLPNCGYYICRWEKGVLTIEGGSP